MKLSFTKFWMCAIAAAFLVPSFTSCNENENEYGDNDELYQDILKQYVNTTIKPTYKSLAEAALEMRKANEALKAAPSDANMKAASDAWMKARIAWEISEAFLFGPVTENALDIDGHIDSWPLELVNIQKELSEIKKRLDAGATIGLTGKDAWLMDAEVIGFHVTEYLLYRNGQSRLIADVTTEELHYLTAATEALVWDCIMLYVAWVGEESVSAEMKTVFRENPDVVAHLNNNSAFKNFADKLTSATGYPSWGAALSEISIGASGIAEEVGLTKIASPYDDKKTEEVESWYSWHSIDDYKNNIESIKNGYLGGMNNSTRTSISLSYYVAQVDSELDKQVKAKIEDCIAKIGNMGKGTLSFYEVVRDQVNKAEVDAAVQACEDLKALLDKVTDRI